MNEKDYQVLLELKDYFFEHRKDLIFSNEMYLDNDVRAKMFYVKTDAISEKNNYKHIFQEYLFLYARSYESLHHFRREYDSLTSDLINYGKKIWENQSLLRVIDYKKSGVFGELFNDFYLNIVRNQNILMTYSTRRGYSEVNIKGVDVVGCTYEDDGLTLIYSESKFMTSASNAHDSLRDDINGTEKEKSHITKEYINSFTDFLVDKNHSLYDDSKNQAKIIIDILDVIQGRIVNGEEAIDIFNELNVKMRFVFFAVYTDNKFTPKDREQYYKNILDDFNRQIINVGINKYEIEIVFIPIVNESTKIKGFMCEWN